MTLQAKNVGLSKVAVVQTGSALRVLTYLPQDSLLVATASESRWNRIATVPIFTDHGWIEPGETIREQRLFDLPTESLEIVQVGLSLVSKDHAGVGNAVITASDKGGRDGES